MVNRWVVLGWLNIRGRVFVPVHTTVNHRWPDMTPGKSITTHDCIGLLRERVCVYVCVCGLSSPSPHCDKSWNWVLWCVEGRVCVCVCLLWGSLWVYWELYMSESVSCPALAGLCTYSHRGRPSAYLCETAASLARWQGLSWIYRVAPLWEKHNARERKRTGRLRDSKTSRGRRIFTSRWSSVFLSQHFVNLFAWVRVRWVPLVHLHAQYSAKLTCLALSKDAGSLVLYES